MKLSASLAHLVLILALAFGAPVLPETGAASMDDTMIAQADDTAQGACNSCETDMMDGAKCIAGCSVAPAEIVDGASIVYPSMRLFWQLVDLDANGLRPEPDPAPPRA